MVLTSGVPRMVFLGTLMLGAGAAVVGATYERTMRRRALHDYSMAGEMVAVDGARRVQMDCRGSGAPTVVLEAGLDHLGALSWAAVHDSIARTARVCAYSRAGLLWSDPSSRAFDARGVVRDLHAALLAAGESPPWVMVGHSLGAAYVLSFVHEHPAEVAGLVLIDPTHPDQFSHFHAVVGKSLQPPAGMMRAGSALAWSGLLRMVDVRNDAWPRAANEAPAELFPLAIGALGAEARAIPATLREAREVTDVGARPLVVLSAGNATPAASLREMGLTRDQGTRLQRVQHQLHADLAARSRNGRHELVPNSSHYIQFDRPDVVIRAIREVVCSVGDIRAVARCSRSAAESLP